MSFAGKTFVLVQCEINAMHMLKGRTWADPEGQKQIYTELLFGREQRPKEEAVNERNKWNGGDQTRYTLFLKCAHFQSVTDSSAYKLSSYRTRQFCNTGYSVQRDGADSTTRSANSPTPPSTSPLQGLFFLNSCFLVYSLYFCFGC